MSVFKEIRNYISDKVENTENFRFGLRQRSFYRGLKTNEPGRKNTKETFG